MWNATLVIAVALASAAAFGCTGTTGLDDTVQESFVLVGDPSIQYDDATDVLRFEIPVHVRNHLQNEILFNECDVALERREGSEWREVWLRICNLGRQNQPDVRVGPGDEAAFVLKIDGALGRSGLDHWTPPLAGDYRVKVFVQEGEDRVAAELQVSPAFRLQE